MPFFFVLGCGSTPRWDDLQLEIDQKFPDVRQLSIERFQSMDSKKLLLVDVRAKEEFEVSHLKGAVWEPREEKIVQLIQEHSPEKVVLYCSVGYRSSAMAQKLQEAGIRDVFNLKGSMFEWANMGLPVWRGDQLVHEVHPYNKNWGTLLDSRYHPNANPTK